MAKVSSSKDLQNDALTFTDDGIQAAKQNNTQKISDAANNMYGAVKPLVERDKASSGKDSKKSNTLKKVWKTINATIDKPNKATPKTFKKMKKDLNRLDY
ncbi:MAG: hypothetical protein AJITA_00577 [Acetilactobacillus jinshanensis]